MLARHIRLAGVRLIETALSSKHATDKHAVQGIQAITPAQLRQKHLYNMRKLPSAKAPSIAKVVRPPAV